MNKNIGYLDYNSGTDWIEITQGKKFGQKKAVETEAFLCFFICVLIYGVFLSKETTLYEQFSTSFDFPNQLDSDLYTHLEVLLIFLQTEVNNLKCCKIIEIR